MIARFQHARRQVAAFAILLALVAAPALLVGAEKEKAAPVDVKKIFAGEAPANVLELKAMQERVQKLAKQVIPCTVNVRIGRGRGQAQGSGVIVSEDGYVLTAAHVNGAPGRDVVFTFADGKTAKGKTLGIDVGVDAGLMKITDEGKWPHVELGDSDTLNAGQWLLATGHPGGYQKGRPPVVRLGRVLMATDSAIMTDCTLVGGDSGGPLFDMDGKVIGIHSRISEEITQNIHVPVQNYQDHWDQLVDGDRIGVPVRAFVGVIRDDDAGNCRILAVHPDSPADKAKIMPGDVITKFDGKDVPDFDALVVLVRRKKPGDKVKIEVLRDEDRFELELVLAKVGG